MKKISLILIIVTTGLFATLSVHAQGTLYLSNLGEPSLVGSSVVGSDAWITQSFITGTNLGGYNLNSIQLLMGAASGSPGGFSISVYSQNGIYPGSSLGNLSGPDPAAAGVFTYNTVGMSLSPSTRYFIVLTAATPVALGNYSPRFTSTFVASSSDGWLMGAFPQVSTDGFSWSRGGPIFQFGVYATAVPEPSTLALAGLGLAALSLWRLPARK